MLFFLALLAWGCNPAEKSINEPLTLDQINRVVKKNPDYEQTFSLVERYQNKNFSNTEKARVNDLTYKRLHKFLEKFHNLPYQEKMETQYKQEWKEKYGPLFDKVDSVDAYWRQYRKDHELDSYVRIDWTEIDKNDPDIFLGYAAVTFRIVPLKGKIEELEAYYGLVPNGSTPFYTYFETTGRNHLHIEQPFAAPVSSRHYLNFNTGDISASDLKESSLAEVKEMYHFDTWVTRLKIDGQYVRPADVWNAIPSCVKTLWEQRNKDSWNDFSRDLYYTDIVKELISPDYISQNDYVRTQLRAHYYELDELAAGFLYEMIYQ